MSGMGRGVLEGAWVLVMPPQSDCPRGTGAK